MLKLLQYPYIYISKHFSKFIYGQFFILVILSLILFTTSPVNALEQNFSWAKQIGSTGTDEGFSVSMDSLGNVYTVGYFNGTVDFNPGAGVSNLTSVGFADIFISKLDSSGNFVWAKQMGGTGTEKAHFMAIDNLDNLYITGYFNGTVDFDPGAGTSNLTPAGSNDIFIAKLNSSGDFVWAKQMGGTSSDISYFLALDTSGNVYTTGSFNGTADFDPGAGVSNLTSAGITDIFVSKLDSSGNFVWAKNMGGTSSDLAYSLALDSSGNVFTTGYFSGTADFDPGAGTSNLISAGGNDIFVSKLDSSGNFVWAKQFSAPGSQRGYSITTDSSGNVYTTGYFSDTIDFDPGASVYNLTPSSFDIFISKLDSSGNFVWAKQMGGTSSEQTFSITTDSSDNIYTTGYFNGTADFDPGAGTSNLISAGGNDIFVSKLDSSGNFVWAKQIGGTGSDYGSAMKVNSSNNVYVTGYFENTVDFDSGAGVSNLTSAGSGDIFILKLEEVIPPSVSSVSGPSGSYNPGTSVDISIIFSSSVNVTGTPTLELETGATDQLATYTSGSGTNTLVFTYTVQLGNFSSDLDYTSTTSLSLNGGTIKDSLNNSDAILTLPAPGTSGSLAFTSNMVISPPPTVSTVSGTNGSYSQGASVTLSITFSNAVNVTGFPTLTLETGDTNRTAVYSGGSGTNTLTFLYTVVGGDIAVDLDYLNANALSLNGGTIIDASNSNTAILTLPTPGTSGSLSNTSNISVTYLLGGGGTSTAPPVVPPSADPTPPVDIEIPTTPIIDNIPLPVTVTPPPTPKPKKETVKTPKQTPKEDISINEQEVVGSVEISPPESLPPSQTSSSNEQENIPPIISETKENFFADVGEMLEESFQSIKSSSVQAVQETKILLKTKEGNIAEKTIAVSGVFVGASFVAASTLFATPPSLSEFFFIPLRLFSLMMGTMSTRRRGKPWGVVYDSVTKQPLDPVYLLLRDMEGKVVATALTDIDGRYGFLVDPGKYAITATKTHYSFPSMKMKGKVSDELYDNVYLGNYFIVEKEGDIIAKNIPLDPLDFDWNEFQKKEKNLMSFHKRNDATWAKISNVLFLIGFFVAMIAFFLIPEPYNVIILALYIIIFLFKQFGIRNKKRGSVVDKNTGYPLSFGILRVFYQNLDKEISHSVIDKFGHFYCLVKNGTYRVKIDRKNPDGSYSEVYRQDSVEIKNGILNSDFAV